MIKILFLIHDLGQGGAEKVLVNLVNNMDREKFDITVTALFGGGVNEQFLAPDIKYHTVFQKMLPGNSHLMKLLSPEKLHSMCVKEHYDIEVSYLEGPSARIISGCRDEETKLVSWIHCTMNSQKDVSESFRNIAEAEKCYNRMDRMVFVAENVRDNFMKNCNYKGNTAVLYNTIESEKVKKMSQEEAPEINRDKFCLAAMGTLKEVKGFDRLLRIVKRLRDEKYPVHLYLLGSGPMRDSLEQYIIENGLKDAVSLLGYQTNPYKYISKCHLFVCSSYSEGFSTAVTEALILGVPTCTVDVSGMREMLGKNNEYGVITKNKEEFLYNEIKYFIKDSDYLKHYRAQSIKRGSFFRMEQTVGDVEDFFMGI